MNSPHHDTDTMFTLMIQKRQANAAAGGLLPIGTYGLYFLYCLYVQFIPNGWTATATRGELLNTSLGLFIGTIIGALLGCYAARKFRKIFIYLFVDIVTIVSGALIIPGTSIILSQIATYLGGFAQGIAMVTILVHTPEVATNNLRGSVVAVVSLMIATSFLVGGWFLSITSLLTDTDLVRQMLGGYIVLFGVIALAFIKCFTMESPVFLIENNQEQDAYNLLKKLRFETHDTYEVQRDFQDLKLLINDDKCLESVRFNDKGLLHFLRLALLRVLYALSTSTLMLALQLVFVIDLSPEYGIGLMMSVRFIIELFVLLLVEKTGRRKLLIYSSMGCGFLMIASAIVAFAGSSISHGFTILAAFAIAYQFFIGLGLGPVSLVYISELFSLKRKAASVAGILIVENIVQIICILIATYASVNLGIFFVVVACLQMAGGVYLYSKLPETKSLTLRQCLQAIK